MNLYHLLPARYQVATDPLRTERKIELAALLLALVLCFQLLYSGARLALLSMPEAVAPAKDALTVGDLRPLRKVSGEQSSRVLARPLFWEGRRPKALNAASAAPARDKAGEVKGIKLLGVFGDGENAGIIVNVKDRQRRLLLGEQINGWTLESVAPNEIVLSSRGRRETLPLRKGKPIAVVPPGNKGSAGLSNVRSRTRTTDSASRSGGEDELSLGGGPRK